MSNSGCIGYIEFDVDKDIWRFEHNFDYSGDAPTFIKFSRKYNLPVNEWLVKDWVCERAPEPDFALIDDLMKEISIKDYDAIAFFTAYNGRTNRDEFYVEELGI
jgi:hypothetical protein